MRTIVIGDVHGCYEELKELMSILEEAEEYKRGVDKLIFLGDYIDRGKDSRKVIEFIRKLQKENDNVIALKGNHEDMLINYNSGKDTSWTFNGSRETINSYKSFEKQFKNDIKWMKKLPTYHEDKYFIYVHAGIDTSKPMEEQDENDLLWIREPFIYSTIRYHKQVIFGHTPTANLTGEWKPVQTFRDNIGIDTGCVFGGALTALIINDDEVDGFYQVNKIKNKIKA